MNLIYHTTIILLHRPFISQVRHDPSDDLPKHGKGHHQDTDNVTSFCQHTFKASRASHFAGPANESRRHTSNASSRLTSDSPYDSHGICTASSRFISLALNLISRKSPRDVMPFSTFYQLTAGSFHLNNIITTSEGWVERLYLAKSLKTLEVYKKKWAPAKGAYEILEELVETHRINLNQVSENTKIIYQKTLDLTHSVDKQAREINYARVRSRVMTTASSSSSSKSCNHHYHHNSRGNQASSLSKIPEVSMTPISRCNSSSLQTLQHSHGVESSSLLEEKYCYYDYK